MILAEIDEFRVPDAAQAAEDGSNQFMIENGMVLHGFPREKPDDAAFAWPGEEARYVDGELFEENAHFLLENRERIFADSRMFLAPVNVMSGAAYIGSLVKPTVGTYIEWWLRRGKDELAYFVSGSPLSGANVSKAISKDGSLVSLPSPGIFLNLVKEFTNAHKRYIEERRRFKAYSLLEVVMRLKNIDPSYEDAFKAQVLERRKSVLEKVVGALKKELAEVKRRCQSYKDKYKNCLRHNQEKGAGESDAHKSQIQ